MSELRISVDVDRGPDDGQNFGSLFEAPTADGAAVLGAGFQGLYNTYHRTDRHVVQFFLRPTDGDRVIEAEGLPRPTPLAGTYLFDLDGTLYASGEQVRAWEAAAAEWTVDPDDASERMRLGAHRLTFAAGQGYVDGQPLLPAPDRGDYQSFYYAHGQLFFYHTFPAGRSEYRLYRSDDEGFSKLYACPWTPGEAGGVDLRRSTVTTLPVVGEVPFSYGQHGDEVLTCSNIGGVYVFDGRGWRTAVEPEIETSYQVYSMIGFYDRLLLGQYPSGQLFEYRGADVRLVEGWPPVMPGVSRSAREAQTMSIYGGELFVGVWPWAEVWRYAPDARRWVFVRRMFTQPPVTDDTVHPYEHESAAAGFVANQWGQRVTSLVPLGPDLMVATSAKSPVPWEPASAFVGDGWREYGAVTRLTMPGSLSAPVRWTEGSTRLNFVYDGRTMQIRQDGELLASTPVAPSLAHRARGPLQTSKLTWGRGVFGAYGGAALSGRIDADRGFDGP